MFERLMITEHVAVRDGKALATIQYDGTDAILSYPGEPKKTRTYKTAHAAKGAVSRRFGTNTVGWQIELYRS